MRLLLAEDERDLAKALETILKYNNYSVDVVENGEDALLYLDGENYDGVILDIMIPKVDGISVLKTIRKKGNRVPVLLLTAKGEVEDRVLGLDSGADDYLGKPFDSKELLARIRAITRRQGDLTNIVLEYGSLKLNTKTFLLATSYGDFKLANKEYQMMEMLMKKPGNLVPTELFMEKIWGYDSDTEINVVWVYISYLRKKLGVLKADVQIKARRNLGYVLEKKE